MPPIRQDELLLRLLKDVNEIRSALRRVTANLPLFDIANENTPAVISANQNNYVPGNYDILRLSSSLNVSITGIANGKKGRRLQIFNVGGYSISLSHQSASSTANNRFKFVNNSDFIIPPDGNALIYYDETAERWVGGDMASIYDVANESTPAQITSNQNNYDIGLSEVLRLSTDAARSITGISGGVKGRSLRIFNVGSYNITLPYESASSSAENRFYTPSGENTVLYPKSGVWLYYDSITQRWRIPDAPTWMGTYGVSFSARYTAPQSIPSGSTTQITNWTVVEDDWSMFNAGAQKLVIPYTGVYTGVLAGSFEANVNGYRGLSWNYITAGTYIMPQRVPAITDPGEGTWMSAPMAWKFNAGDEVSVACQHTAGVNLDFSPEQWFLARVR